MDAWPSPPQVSEQDIMLGCAHLDKILSSGLLDSHIAHAPVDRCLSLPYLISYKSSKDLFGSKSK